MDKLYVTKKQWRAVGACEFDVFFRDTKAGIGEDIVGEPEECWAVLKTTGRPCTENDPWLVIADCYRPEHAKMVANALNKAGRA